MHERVDIRQRVTQALEEVINERGTNGISVSLIAQKANLNTAFIYRYFGGVQELLAYYVRQSQTFPHFMVGNLEQLMLVHGGNVDQLCSGQMIQFFRQLRTSKVTRELIKTSIVSDNLLAQTLDQTQHEELISLVQRIPLSEEAASPATLAILLGGMYYLTIMAHNDQPIMGIDLRSESGWLQIEESIRTIYRRLCKPSSALLSRRNHPTPTQSQTA